MLDKYIDCHVKMFRTCNEWENIIEFETWFGKILILFETGLELFSFLLMFMNHYYKSFIQTLNYI